MGTQCNGCVYGNGSSCVSGYWAWVDLFYRAERLGDFASASHGVQPCLRGRRGSAVEAPFLSGPPHALALGKVAVWKLSLDRGVAPPFLAAPPRSEAVGKVVVYMLSLHLTRARDDADAASQGTREQLPMDMQRRQPSACGGPMVRDGHTFLGRPGSKVC